MARFFEGGGKVASFKEKLADFDKKFLATLEKSNWQTSNRAAELRRLGCNNTIRKVGPSLKVHSDGLVFWPD